MAAGRNLYLGFDVLKLWRWIGEIERSHDFCCLKLFTELDH